MSTDERQRDIVTISFNGADKEVPYQPHAAVQALLNEAKRLFNVQSNHLLSLFTEGNVELNDNLSAEQAGVVPGMLLILRQSTTKGGV